jgi:hypothetical protein
MKTSSSFSPLARRDFLRQSLGAAALVASDPGRISSMVSARGHPPPRPLPPETLARGHPAAGTTSTLPWGIAPPPGDGHAPLPPVIRSERHLLRQGLSFPRGGLPAPSELPISAEGVTYNLAQTIAWVDADHFAVGRWDGTLTVFRFSEAKSKGPLITVAASSPSSEGVQMVTRVAPGVIATSNDHASLALWSPTPSWDRLRLVAWHDKRDNSYWINNTLSQSLSEEQMIAIAVSMRSDD